jgi:N-methylhydantoinase B
MKGKGFQTVPADDRLLVMTPGGAGIGDPRERPAAGVRDDLESELVSAEKSATVYGRSRQ